MRMHRCPWEIVFSLNACEMIMGMSSQFEYCWFWKWWEYKTGRCLMQNEYKWIDFFLLFSVIRNYFLLSEMFCDCLGNWSLNFQSMMIITKQSCFISILFCLVSQSLFWDLFILHRTVITDVLLGLLLLFHRSANGQIRNGHSV